MDVLDKLKATLLKYYQNYTALLQWILLFLFGAWIIYVDPYDIGAVGERKSEEVLYRLSASLYDSQKSEAEILVILFNDKSINNLYPKIWESNDWPLSYIDQVNLLSTIMAQSPAALFYDVMWMKQRSTDASFNRAIEKLKRTQQVTGTPLFMAKGSIDSLMTVNMQTQLQAFSQLAINGWQGKGEQYPLYIDELPTATMMLYQIYCQTHSCQPMEADSSYPVSVRWSSLAAPVLLPHRQAECENPTTNLIELSMNIFSSVMHNIVPGLTATNKKTICPSQRVLYADEVMALSRSPIQSERDMLNAWISDSIVLVGGQIDGIYDYVVSPVHGTLPGVFFHAMALDNLIVYGDAYTQEVPYSKTLNLLIWAIYILALVMLKRTKLTHPLIQFLQQKLWLMCFVYITLMLSLLFVVFHASPSSWISLITLGWIGVKVIDRLEMLYEVNK